MGCLMGSSIYPSKTTDSWRIYPSTWGCSMPKRATSLTALQVRRMAAPGLYADGNGLYLQVTKTGAKSWIYRYQLHGRRRDMGLGSADFAPRPKIPGRLGAILNPEVAPVATPATTAAPPNKFAVSSIITLYFCSGGAAYILPATTDALSARPPLFNISPATLPAKLLLFCVSRTCLAAIAIRS